MWRAACVVVMVLALMMGPALASAQEASGAGVLALVTEEVEEARGPAVTFWWQDLAARKLSGTDEALRGALSRHGVRWEEPAAGANASKIYRVARLSLANATALAGVLGMRGRVVVGRVWYERVAAVPMAPAGWMARVEVELMEAGWRTGGQTVRITLERAAYGEDAQEGLRGLRAEVGEAMGRLIAGWVRRGEGPVGVYGGAEPLVVLRGVEQGAQLEDALRRMRAVQGVKAVAIAWSARGQIALEINPGEVDKAELVGYAAQALIGQEQAAWRFEMAATQRPGEAVMMELVQTQAQQGAQ